MGNNSIPKFIFRLSRFPVYRGSVLGRFYCNTTAPGRKELYGQPFSVLRGEFGSKWMRLRKTLYSSVCLSVCLSVCRNVSLLLYRLLYTHCDIHTMCCLHQRSLGAGLHRPNGWMRNATAGRKWEKPNAAICTD